MCLYANREARNGDAPPPRTTAYKVVLSTRFPIFNKGASYTDGATIEVPRSRILRDLEHNRYYFGLHVFTSLTRAGSFAAPGELILQVTVSPDDWVAENTREHEAVYSRLFVVGEVK